MDRAARQQKAIENWAKHCNIKIMYKRSPTKATRRAPQYVDGHRVLGVTHDGVAILDPGPATHFTDKEIDEAIRIVLLRRRSHAVSSRGRAK
jgi:hypothetical protein